MTHNHSCAYNDSRGWKKKHTKQNVWNVVNVNSQYYALTDASFPSSFSSLPPSPAVNPLVLILSIVETRVSISMG